MAELGQLQSEVTSIAERFDRLESVVEKIYEQLNSAQCNKQTHDEESDNVGRRQVAADEQQHQAMPSAVCGSFSEVQAEFRVIRDSVAKLKLPPGLVFGDSRAGASRRDLPKFNIIQKSARYQETVLTSSFCLPATQLSARYQPSVRQFCALQQNPAAFTPNSLENLQRAVSIAGARQCHQVSSPRGRRFFPAWLGSRGSGCEFQCSPRGGAVAKDFSQLTGAGRGAGLTLTCHVSAAAVGDRPGEGRQRRILMSDLFMLYQ